MQKELLDRTRELQKQTGCGIIGCKKAILFCEENKDCTEIGYLKAKSIAVNMKNTSFLDRVRYFSKERK